MATTITPTGRIVRTPRTPSTTGNATPGGAWKSVAGALAFGTAWIFTVWFVAPLSFVWGFLLVRVVMFPVRVAWHLVRVLACPVWVPVRGLWRRGVAQRGSLVRKVHKQARKGQRSGARTAREMYAGN